MDDISWPLLILIGVVLIAEAGRRWYRRRIAAKLADQLLDDVIKGKDAFRRRQ